MPLNSSYSYSNQLQDINSRDFSSLARQLQQDLLGLYGRNYNNNVIDVAVISFRQGSVIAEHVIATVATDVADLFTAFQSSFVHARYSIVARTPTLLRRLTLTTAEINFPVGSALGLLHRIRDLSRSITKTFTGIIHLRPSVVSRFEDVYDETIMDTNSPVYQNFVAKLTRDLARLHDDKNVVNVKVVKIEFAKPILQRIANSVRSRRTKFFKASTVLLNSAKAFSKTAGLFHKMMRYIPPDYSRRYGIRSRQQESVVVSEKFTGIVKTHYCLQLKMSRESELITSADSYCHRPAS